MPTDLTVKQQRIADLQPIFVLLDARGIKRKWLADALHIAGYRLSKYEHGERGYPQWFIEQASEAIFEAIGVRPRFPQSDQREVSLYERDHHPAPRESQPDKPASKPASRRRSSRRSGSAGGSASTEQSGCADPRVASAGG